MNKNLLKAIISLLIFHTKENYKKNSMVYRIAVLCILYPLKLYSFLVSEKGAEWFFNVTDIKNKFDAVCQAAVMFNINKKGGE